MQIRADRTTRLRLLRSFGAGYCHGQDRILLSAVLLLLGVIIGGALVAPAGAGLLFIDRPLDQRKVTQAIQDLQAGQRKAADQLQAIQQVLGNRPRSDKAVVRSDRHAQRQTRTARGVFRQWAAGQRASDIAGKSQARSPIRSPGRPCDRGLTRPLESAGPKPRARMSSLPSRHFGAGGNTFGIAESMWIFRASPSRT